MNNVNSITICRDDYSSIEEFENAIKKAIMVLLDNNYIMTVKYDANDKELGIVVIEFEYANQEFGCDYPYWLSPEEFEIITMNKEREEMSENE